MATPMDQGAPPPPPPPPSEPPAAEAPAAAEADVEPAAPAEPEGPKELEQDAADIAGPALSTQVGFNAEDTTLNVLPASSGNSLMLLTDNGMQYLLAGARANVGVKAGRYFFEVQVVELLDPQEVHHSRVVQPRQLLRLGFSTSKSSLLLGESEESVCFDSEGFFTQNKTSVQATQRFDRHQVVGLLLNLDASSPNANTVSLFHDGVRVSQPIALPEALKGKTLFPAVTFRNITLSFNFGPTPMAPLPFKCHTLAAAAAQDVEVIAPKQPKEGKYEVIFPILLPDEGSFDWVDLFLQQHPDFTELSDRMVLEWCEKSGIHRSHGYGWRTSNDKPDMSMNVPELDNCGIQQVIRTIAQAQRRNFLVVEIKSNLLQAERKELMAPFRAPHFRRLAQVMVGDPTAHFKMRTQELLLKEKQEKVTAEFQKQQAEESRKRTRELEEKEAQRAAKKARIDAAEAARKAEVERRAAAGEEPLPEDAMKPTEVMDDEPEKPRPDPMEDKPPAAELTEDERKVIFRPSEAPDVSDWVLVKCLNDLTLPDKSEGFDMVTYSWSTRSKAETYFKEWKVTKKLTTRIEDLVVGEWFNKAMHPWKDVMASWQKKQSAWKAGGGAKKETPKDEPPPPPPPPPPQEGGDVPIAEATVEEVKPAEKKDEPMTLGVADEDLDVFGVADILDVGNGEPLFSLFAPDDWILLSLRVELHHMAHSFSKDVPDVDCPGIHVDNIPFYYNRYFRKNFMASNYGLDTNDKVIELVKDTVSLNEKKLLVPEISEDLDSFDIFAKLTEDCRRERQLSMDLGEQGAILKFNQTALLGHPNAAQKGAYSQKGSMKGYQDPKGGKGKPGTWPPQGYDGKGYSGHWGGSKGGYMGHGGGGCKGAVVPPGKGKFNSNFGKGYK